ncbi:MAG TPA: OmcA/MtrC family decaheme c-type cytochrome, partial [Thermoanaerobaculia bacterium]
MNNAVKGILTVVAAAAISLPSALEAAQQGSWTGRVVSASRQTAAPVASDAAVNTVRRQTVTRTEPAPRIPTSADFTVADVEFYLGDDGIAYIRPGLQIKINSIEIPSDRKPVIDVSFTDNFGNPLDRSGKITPGVISASFVLSHWDPTTREYHPVTKRTVTSPATSPTPNVTAVQGTADSGGKWTDLEMGHATYKFNTAIPTTFGNTDTFTLGAYATRNLTDIIGKNYYTNPIKDFRIDGAAVTDTWAKINQPTSCMNCHDELALHGGSRREVRLCVLCHTEGGMDPDTSNSIDMEVLVHKIHSGPNLENGYTIIGFGGSVHDYSLITYPQDRRNCQNCHEGTVPAQKPAQAHNYFTYPTRDACGACHDTINWTTGAGHAGGPQANDDACATCHQPDGPEFGASVKGAHVIPEKSSQLAGVNAKIVSVSNVKAGEKPTIVIKVTNNKGEALDPTKFATFSPILAGPTTSYRTYFREDARSKATFDAATGNTTYTFTNAIPADAKGSFAFSADIYRNATLKRADGEADVTLREAAFNPIHYASLTGGTAAPRRTAVDLAKCNKCHDRLALHGGQRMNT